jgi:fructoselysine-6-phosphate deglycase
VIDTKDYPLEGISEEFRGSISHLVMRAVNARVDVHMEKEFCHPLDIRRYYRQFDY